MAKSHLHFYDLNTASQGPIWGPYWAAALTFPSFKVDSNSALAKDYWADRKPWSRVVEAADPLIGCGQQRPKRAKRALFEKNVQLARSEKYTWQDWRNTPSQKCTFRI